MTAILFPGENCDTLQYSKNVQEKDSENYGSMAAGVVVALILVAIIVALLFYYRRRVANLKTEIAHVQYIADPQAAPGDAEHILLQLVTLFALIYEGLGGSCSCIGRAIYVAWWHVNVVGMLCAKFKLLIIADY